MTRARYKEAAERAVAAKLSPASDDDTRKHWRELGITRQTAFNWGRNGVPIDARLAVAWIMREALR